MLAIRTAILTLSDKGFRGERQDLTGPGLKAELESRPEYCVTCLDLLPDEQDQIEDWLRTQADSGSVDLILTNGGTGFAPRDLTPEATAAVIQRPAPGLAELMRQRSYKITPTAMLSRATAGIRGRTLIVNLPGSPKAALENWSFIQELVGHAVALLRDELGDHADPGPPELGD